MNKERLMIDGTELMTQTSSVWVVLKRDSGVDKTGSGVWSASFRTTVSTGKRTRQVDRSGRWDGALPREKGAYEDEHTRVQVES
jgi:hypothetical protein